ncbi:MAG: 4-hydroxy-3-methylbut-2-enyl diphosphate reductase [Ignavibacteriales bacterium CG_4_9_14_3_um_filter_34_10]|nr:MAG: 4-hydroxy-3-methylbut-2-enyl diphosphate reductase [Ignavibacteriales bacterium CG_4_9_14_3_um_filter_34_10]
MKNFDIPDKYKSNIISRIKQSRKLEDPRKKDFSPTVIDFGEATFLIARHFGFCYGVENAIEIAYKTLEDNKGKNIYLLSEMIHNPSVNEDLISHGIRFLMDTEGNELIGFDSLTNEDIVIIPAFGTTLGIENNLKQRGIDPYKYNTTCPFVEKVWNRAAALGEKDYTIIVHGKSTHEETRATFSHSQNNTPTVIIRDIFEAEVLSKIISGELEESYFYEFFNGKFSEGFDVKNDLNRIGVVNQTTMLASETQAIAEKLKETMKAKFGEENLEMHFADTRDTLCYATNDNQSATLSLLTEDVDIAIVVGGYNSSNTSHLVELLETKFKTFFIFSENNIISKNEIVHFDFHNKKEVYSKTFLPEKEKIRIAITSGASCPDSVVDNIISKILSFFPKLKNMNEIFPIQV